MVATTVMLPPSSKSPPETIRTTPPAPSAPNPAEFKPPAVVMIERPTVVVRPQHADFDGHIARRLQRVCRSSSCSPATTWIDDPSPAHVTPSGPIAPPGTIAADIDILGPATPPRVRPLG
jgi:hypothetical protein